MPKPSPIYLSGQMTQWSSDGGKTWNAGGFVLQNPDGSTQFTGYPQGAPVLVQATPVLSVQNLAPTLNQTLQLSGIDPTISGTQLVIPTAAGASSTTLTLQGDSQDSSATIVQSTMTAQGGSITQTATISQSGVVSQSGSNSQSGSISQSGSNSQSGSISQSGGNVNIG